MSQNDVNGYPIREFARLTGVNPVTLRAWERRYGIIQPLRTPKGHRYYTDEHVEQVRNILYWLEQGYPIRQVKLLLSAPPERDTQPGGDWEELTERMILAACELNSRQLDEEWNTGLASYPMAVYYERCLCPVLDRLRQNAQHAMILEAFTYLLTRKLSQLISLQQKHAEGPSLLLATNHVDGELPLLASAYALGAAGLKVEYFGTEFSPAYIRIAADIVKSSWVWVHMHPSRADQQQPWLHLTDEVSLPVFYSGDVPDSVAQDKHLEASLGRQIQTFITRTGDLS